MTDIKKAEERGDYPQTWKHLEQDIRLLVKKTSDYIVFIDQDDDVDWETTKNYDDLEEKHPNFDIVARNEILHRVALLEATPCDGLSKPIKQQFKRLLCEALGFCFECDYFSARQTLESAQLYIQSRAQETSRYWYLSATFVAAGVFLLTSVISWIFRSAYIEYIGKEVLLLTLSATAGALGALLSVICRSGSIKLDCSAGKYLHYLEGVSRVCAGAISGLLVSIAVRSELIFSIVAKGSFETHITILVSMAAGTGERLATSIVSKFEDMTTSDSRKQKTKEGEGDDS